MRTAKILLFIALAFGSTAFAQVANKCESGFNAFEQSVLAGKYDEAAVQMAELRKKCPKHSDKLYTYGETVLLYRIEMAMAPADKQGQVADLAALYTEYAQNYPKSDAVIKKALLQQEYKLADDKELYKALDGAFTSNSMAFIDYNALEAYFELLLKQYDGAKTISQEQFIEKYGAIGAQVAHAKSTIAADKDALLKKQETEKLTAEESNRVSTADNKVEALGVVAENMALQASRIFDCSKLEAYYDKHYEVNKGNASWLEGLTTAMYGSKCFNSPVLYKGAQALNTAKPTAQTAYMLASIELKRRNPKQAVVYFDQSAALEKTPARKAALYHDIASIFRNSDKGKAKEYALKAAAQNPKFGKPYLMLAEMYTTAGKECGLSEFERKALTLLAIETVKKAEVAEPRYKTTVASLVKNFEKNLPTDKEAKAAGKRKGDVISYGCWINEKVTLPKL